MSNYTASIVDNSGNEIINPDIQYSSSVKLKLTLNTAGTIPSLPFPSANLLNSTYTNVLYSTAGTLSVDQKSVLFDIPSLLSINNTYTNGLYLVQFNVSDGAQLQTVLVSGILYGSKPNTVPSQELNTSLPYVWNLKFLFQQIRASISTSVQLAVELTKNTYTVPSVLDFKTYTSASVSNTEYEINLTFNQYGQFDLRLYIRVGVSEYYVINKFINDFKLACFLKGTKILCSDNTWISVEDLKVGTWIQSTNQRIFQIGAIGINTVTVNDNTHIKDRIYSVQVGDNKISLTGGHPILVDHLSEDEKEKTIKNLGIIRKLNNKIQLYTMFNDASVDLGNSKEGSFYETFNFYVLDSPNKDESVEVFANGILTECCSENYFINEAHFNEILKL
jgi:hypothetical protein